jgi:tRNA pseudouridine55 synthase
VPIPSEGRVLLLDKPVGPTSFDAVAAVKRGWQSRRVGHTGTLDPLAGGLLVVCVGEATKLVPFLTDCDKVYDATIRLGRETRSGDVDGETLSEASADVVAAVETPRIVEALARLTGEIEQRPPVFSAIKVDGKPLYARARAGEDVEAPLRQVRVDAFDLIAREGADLHVRVACGKGTYIRSLAIDVGRAMGTGGHLIALRRTRLGPFDVADACTLDAFKAAPENALAQAIRPGDAMPWMPRRVPSPELEMMIRQGKAPLVDWGPGRFTVLTETGTLIAVVDVDAAGMLRVVRGFVEQPA